ncbi:MAG: flagellar export protein FliJ [Deltaproteobacteria bacterium]|nr:flagellar export protein FliJ [Deltaproteobacteria bacterium]
MKDHKFKLDRVLEYKTSLEGLLKKEYMALKGKAEAEEEKLRKEMKDYEAHVQGLVEKGEITARELSVYNSRMDGLKVRLKKGCALVDDAKKETEKKREELVEASKGRKTLDALKNKDIVRHIRSEIKKEQRLTDEFSTNRFFNKED